MGLEDGEGPAASPHIAGTGTIGYDTGYRGIGFKKGPGGGYYVPWYG